jgi:hypothetical protein
MSGIVKINDLVIRFANVNGTERRATLDLLGANYDRT